VVTQVVSDGVKNQSDERFTSLYDIERGNATVTDNVCSDPAEAFNRKGQGMEVIDADEDSNYACLETLEDEEQIDKGGVLGRWSSA